jgi:hypothetical protein
MSELAKLIKRLRDAAQYSREYGPITNAPLLDEAAAALERGVWVPREPTKEILDAAVTFFHRGSYLCHPEVRDWNGTMNGDSVEAWQRDLYAAAYKAMLAAAPVSYDEKLDVLAGRKRDDALPE